MLCARETKYFILCLVFSLFSATTLSEQRVNHKVHKVENKTKQRLPCAATSAQITHVGIYLLPKLVTPLKSLVCPLAAPGWF